RIVHTDPGPDRVRYRPRRVRHMKDHGRVAGAGKQCEGREGRGDIGRTGAPGSWSVPHRKITVPHAADSAATDGRPGSAGTETGRPVTARVTTGLRRQASEARAWFQVADGRMTAEALAGSGW